MVWRVSHFPPLKKDLISPSTSGFLKGRQLTPQLSVIMKSTYQDDYLGAQQGTIILLSLLSVQCNYAFVFVVKCMCVCMCVRLDALC